MLNQNGNQTQHEQLQKRTERRVFSVCFFCPCCAFDVCCVKKAITRRKTKERRKEIIRYVKTRRDWRQLRHVEYKLDFSLHQTSTCSSHPFRSEAIFSFTAWSNEKGPLKSQLILQQFAFLEMSEALKKLEEWEQGGREAKNQQNEFRRFLTMRWLWLLMYKWLFTWTIYFLVLDFFFSFASLFAFCIWKFLLFDLLSNWNRKILCLVYKNYLNLRYNENLEHFLFVSLESPT